MIRPTSLAFIALAITPALGGELPRYDVEAMCRAAPSLEAGARNTDRSCVRDETQAREQLAQHWSGFNAQRREACVQEASIGGPPSYVALLTCMQM
jgi:hypothetical protein